MISRANRITANSLGGPRPVRLLSPGALQSSPLSQFGVPLVCAFLFMAYARVADYMAPSLHLPMVTGVLACLLALMNGGVQRTLSSRIGVLLVIFTVWLVLITPLSYWRTGSIQTLMRWSKSFIVFFMIVGLVNTLKQCRRVMYGIALGVLVITMLVLLLGSSKFGRWAVPGGMLDNPNDLAQILLLGVPFFLLAAMNEERVPFRRALACMGGVPVVFIVMFTGSRSGAIALAAVFLVAFYNVSMASKIKMIVAGGVLAIFAVALAPGTLVSRFAVLLQDEPGEIESTGAELALESKLQRVALLKESLKITLMRPLFGVGPGQFQSYQSHVAGGEGEKALWRETHCTYTQVSSETGLPGFFLYMGVLIMSLKGASSIYKRTRRRREFREVSAMAFALVLSLTSFAVTALFSSVAYHNFLPTLAGLSVAFISAAEAEMKARQSASSQTVVPMVTPAPRRVRRQPASV